MNYQTFRNFEAKAREMNVPVSQAIGARVRYLVQHVAEVAELPISNDTEEVLCIDMVTDSFGELDYLKHKLAAMKNGPDLRELTDEMIDRARAYPITRLVEFGRDGKATAPCHDDKNPSMYYATRKGFAYCPVCDKKFDAIRWLMDVEGKSFMEAVKWLNHN